MGRTGRWAAALAAIWFAGAALAAEGLPARFDRPISPGGPDAVLFQEAVLFYVNAARRQAGRPALAGDARLRAVAVGHAGKMAAQRDMSHRLKEPRPRLADRLADRGVRFRAAAENIAMDKTYRLLGRPIAAGARGCAFTYADTGAPVPVHTNASLAAAVVARWLASPGHRANILDPRFRRMGAGAAIDPLGPACGDVYLAQAFAG